MRGKSNRLLAFHLFVATTAFAASAPAAAAEDPARAVATNRPTVCIAAFTDETGGRASDGIAPAVRDLLAAKLSDQRAVTVLDRDDLDRVLKEQALGAAGFAAPEGRAKIGHLLGAQRFVTGSVVAEEGKIIVVANVLDVASAVVAASCRASGRPQDLTDVVANLAAQLAKALQLPFDPGAIRDLDASPLASLHYLRGIGYFHAGNYDRAIMEFMTCGDLQQDARKPHYWSGRAFCALGEFEHGQVELDRFLSETKSGPEADDARKLLETCARKLRDAPVPALPTSLLQPVKEGAP